MRPDRRTAAILIPSALCLLAALGSQGCTPTFNWREVTIADQGLVALLPCKADRASRTLALGTDTVTIDMAGCEAGGATFAVAHTTASGAAQADTWMRAWRAATRSQIGPQSVVTEAPFSVAKAAAAPAAVRLDAKPLPADSSGTESHMVWFAASSGGAVSIYQAMVVGKPNADDALQTFIEGLRLP